MVAQSLQRGQLFQQIMRGALKEVLLCLCLELTADDHCVFERDGKYTVNKNGGHTLHKRTAIKTQRALLTLML